ncbi:thiosulfate sulfurtransferase 16, chloroplastic isoform X1 [Arachis ipaensis]|uniref:thiosulfate sulfurtransferase 16, chloroplastic isoform X1 n=1 Tax=Arachis ipaensis TaxID=130454 RepID=UPI0007AF80C1|nr:thiosulfate sulfurtransferase 16, chloroplastic isoform X1 [Arachis ipaensis]
MKSVIATSFDVSGACLSSRPSLLNAYHTTSRPSSIVAINYQKEYSSRRIRVEPKFPFRREAGLSGSLEAVGVPTSVPVRVAHELLLAGHRYLDVRTPEEFHAGHAPGAINIPYMFRVGSGMTKNTNFVKEVSSELRKDDEIIVGCQLGKRSMMAATDLLAAGFTGVTDIAGGYAAWTQNNLPTEL